MSCVSEPENESLKIKREECYICKTTTNYYMFLPHPSKHPFSRVFPSRGSSAYYCPCTFRSGSTFLPLYLFLELSVASLFAFPSGSVFPSLYFLYVSFGAVLPGSSVLASRPIPSHLPHAWSFPVRIFLFLSVPAVSVYLFAVYIYILICSGRFGIT